MCSTKLLIVVLLAALVISVRSQECTPESEGRFFEDKESGCEHYLICFNGQLYSGTCPPGLFFEEAFQWCNNHAKVNCINRDPVIVICPPNIAVSNFSYPYSCSRYVQCIFGDQTEQQCPQGEHFSPSESICVPQDTALCTVESAVCPLISNPSEILFIPSSRSCTRHYLCFGRNTVQLDCAPGLRFDRVNLRCDREDIVDCEVAAPAPPPIVEITCSQLTGVVNEPHPTDCRAYFRCIMGNVSPPEPQLCPSGQLFDYILRACNINILAQCAPNAVRP